MRSRLPLGDGLLVLSLLAAPLAAAPIEFAEPDDDRWMYGVNGTPGTRSQASTFSALPGSGGVDDRFAFFLVGFDTDAAIPAGLPEWAYRITRVTLHATIGQDELFSYDPSADPLASFGTPEQPAGVADPDAGRPIELHGAGFRNGFKAADFTETSAHGGGAPGQRNAYPLGFDAAGAARDVSNHVTDGFDPRPWAIGSCALAPGAAVPVDTEFTFELDLARPAIADYLRQSLAAGRLWLSISSLHPATQMGGEFVSFYTKEDAIHQLLGGLAPRLEIEVEIVQRLKLERVGDESRLSWPQLAGMTHTLKANGDPGPDGWQTLGSWASTANGSGAFTDTTTLGKRFYTLEITPTP